MRHGGKKIMTKINNTTNPNNINPLAKKLSSFCMTALGLFSVAAFAQDLPFNGGFTATEAEKAHHKANIMKLAEVAYTCMDREHTRHARFYDRYRISPFYGTGTAFAKMTVPERERFLQQRGLPKELLSQMEMTSCVGFAIKCFDEGFTAIGQADVWKRINSYAGRNNYDGSAVIDALRTLGWYVMYWNPDTKQNQKWDEDEQKRDADNSSRIWGYHSYRWATVNRPGNEERPMGFYYKNIIDDKTTLVDYGTRVPSVFRQAPIFWGIAHTGFHVFPGSYGHIVEAHSTRSLTDRQTVERADFNPLASGGAPRGKYYSGLVAVPPGYEPHNLRESDPVPHLPNAPRLPTPQQPLPDVITIPGLTPPTTNNVCRVEMRPTSGEYYMSVNGRPYGRMLGTNIERAIQQKRAMIAEGTCVADPNAARAQCDLKMTVERGRDGRPESNYYVTRNGIPFSSRWRLSGAAAQMRMMRSAGECVAKPASASKCEITLNHRRTAYFIARTDLRSGQREAFSFEVGIQEMSFLRQWLSDLVKEGACVR